MSGDLIHNIQGVLIYARIVSYVIMVWALFLFAIRIRERNRNAFWAMLSMAGFVIVLSTNLVLARIGGVGIEIVRTINDLGLTPFLLATVFFALRAIVEMDREHTREIEEKNGNLTWVDWGTGSISERTETETVSGYPANWNTSEGEE